MCKFKSAIVTRGGDIFEYPETDSHEHIIAANGFRDDGSSISSRSWIRVEFTPPEDVKDLTTKSKWMLYVDEACAPDWWEDMKDTVRDSLWIRIKRMMVKDERQCLIGGSWILLPGSRVHQMVRARIIRAIEADLSGSDLSGSNLSRSNLSGSNLSGSNLSGSNLSGSNLRCSNLSGSDRYATDPPIAGWKIQEGILVRE